MNELLDDPLFMILVLRIPMYDYILLLDIKPNMIPCGIYIYSIIPNRPETTCCTRNARNGVCVVLVLQDHKLSPT
jgi:hypothetical protein